MHVLGPEIRQERGGGTNPRVLKLGARCYERQFAKNQIQGQYHPKEK